MKTPSPTSEQPAPLAELDATPATLTKHILKTPTGLAPDPLNILILGASFAGLSCAHHFFDYTITQLRITKAAPTYRLVIVSPSTHIYWNIGAPRALVAAELIEQDDLFIPIEPGFHRHRGHNLSIVQGEAVALDTSARVVTVDVFGSTARKRASLINKRASKAAGSSNANAPASGGGQQQQSPKVQMMSYHALIMATGSSAHSDLLSLHGPHLNTLGALNSFHARVIAAKSIVVCGGGASGVETAGQLGTYLNYTSSFPGLRKRVKFPKSIILITGSDRCLPMLKPKIGLKAEKMLRRLGVEIKHGVRVIAAKEGFDLTGQTKVELNDETNLIADLYVPCTGVAPNSAYVPVELRDERGYVRTNPRTMRVEARTGTMQSRTYAVGDVATYSQNYILDVYTAVPVLMHNLLNDLLAHEYHLASPYGGNQDNIDDLVDDEYVQSRVDSVLCPISRFGGVGILLGVGVPSLLVHRLKGHDYRVRKAKRVVVDGGNPYSHYSKYDKL